MHLSYLFHALGKPRFVNISVSYYSPELCLSGSLSQRVSGSNFLRRSFTLQFPIIPPSPWRPSRPCFLLIHTISCLGLAGSAGRVWQSGEVTGSHGFLSSVSSSSLSAQLISSLPSFSFSCSLCIFSFSNCPTVPGFLSSTSLLSSL